MEIIEKEVIKDSHKDYASRATGNTALGLAIGALGVELLRGGLGNGLFGFGTANGQVAYDYANSQNVQYLERKQCQDYIDITEKYYQGRIADMASLHDSFYNLDAKLNNSAFNLYKNQRDGFDVLASRISALETKQAVADAVEPWRAQVLDMRINGAIAGSQAAVALEAERRACADNKIVNYVNGTFYPIEVANITVGSTATARNTYNPLCPCSCPVVSSGSTSTAS